MSNCCSVWREAQKAALWSYYKTCSSKLTHQFSSFLCWPMPRTEQVHVVLNILTIYASRPLFKFFFQPNMYSKDTWGLFDGSLRFACVLWTPICQTTSTGKCKDFTLWKVWRKNFQLSSSSRIGETIKIFVRKAKESKSKQPPSYLGCFNNKMRALDEKWVLGYVSVQIGEHYRVM